MLRAFLEERREEKTLKKVGKTKNERTLMAMRVLEKRGHSQREGDS